MGTWEDEELLQGNNEKWKTEPRVEERNGTRNVQLKSTGSGDKNECTSSLWFLYQGFEFRQPREEFLNS